MTPFEDDHRLHGQRQARQLERRDGAADAERRVRRRVGVRRRHAAPDRGRRGRRRSTSTELTSYADVFEGLKLTAVELGRRRAVRHAARSRRQPAGVQHRGVRRRRPTAGASMFDGGTAADGAVSVYDSPIYIADAALYLMAHAARSRHHQPVRARPDAVRRGDRTARAAEGARRPVLGASTPISRPRSRAAPSSPAPPGRSSSTSRRATAPRSTRSSPSRVRPAGRDTWMISSKAANPNCMYLWMDWIASPWANAQVAEWFGEAPSQRQGVRADRRMPSTATIFHAEDEDYWTDVWYWTTATEECLDGRTDVTCVPYTEWVNAWTDSAGLTRRAVGDSRGDGSRSPRPRPRGSTARSAVAGAWARAALLGAARGLDAGHLHRRRWCCWSSPRCFALDRRLAEADHRRSRPTTSRPRSRTGTFVARLRRERRRRRSR